MFFTPNRDIFTQTPEFLDAAAAELVSPSESVSTLKLFSIFTRYWKSQKQYLKTKEKFLEQVQKRDINEAMDYIWDGGGTNRNAALTIFRHYDSASVLYGLVGNYPETAWIIDYPLFERIHYLLVAGFDVYGNLGHQLNTRLYMDFLRMEGEDQFLLFLPPDDRRKIRDSWYQGIRKRRAKLMKEPMAWINIEVITGYKTDNPQMEFYRRIERHFGKNGVPMNSLNRCTQPSCDDESDFDTVDRAMSNLSRLNGMDLEFFPDITLVKIVDPDRGDRSYTLILNKSYKNLTSIFSNEENRDREGDTLSVIRGIVGSYPNFFFRVKVTDIDNFVYKLSNIHSSKDYHYAVTHYGIRRTDTRFWETADWFQENYAQQEPISSGILDLNRYRDQ
jgi:hypothetical protein